MRSARDLAKAQPVVTVPLLASSPVSAASKHANTLTFDDHNRSYFFVRRASYQNMSFTAEESGEGAALSFTTCVLSFDGLSRCGVNDTILVNSHVGKKGGAVAIGTGNATSYIEFHRCTVDNATAGRHIEDDPQGEGGAFIVGEALTLVLSHCVLKNNNCGSKVRLRRIVIRVYTNGFLGLVIWVSCTNTSKQTAALQNDRKPTTTRKG